MAASKKRRVAEKNNDNEYDNSNSDSSDNEEMEDADSPEPEVELVDFEALTPDDSDYHAIKKLLQQLFRKAHINTGELADILIQQDYMGSVLKQTLSEDDDDSDEDHLYAVFSIIDITQKKNIECIQQISSYLLDHCKKVAPTQTFENFKALVDDAERHVGLIISERYINIPIQISVPLYESLSEEMKKAKEEGKLSGFAYYVLISKRFEDNSSNSEEVIYANPEEELFDKDAVLKFDFSVSDEQDSVIAETWSGTDAEFKPKRTVMVFPAEKWNVLVEKLKSQIVSVT